MKTYKQQCVVHSKSQYDVVISNLSGNKECWEGYPRLMGEPGIWQSTNVKEVRWKSKNMYLLGCRANPVTSNGHSNV